MSIAAFLWVFAFDLTLLCEVVLAWSRGRGPERIGALLYAVATVGSVVARVHTGQFVGLERSLALIDLWVLAALWLMSIYALRWWPIVAAGAQVLTCLGHLGKMLDPSLAPLAYARLAAFSGWPAVLALGLSLILNQQRPSAGPSWRSSLPPAVHRTLRRWRLG